MNMFNLALLSLTLMLAAKRLRNLPGLWKRNAKGSTRLTGLISGLIVMGATLTLLTHSTIYLALALLLDLYLIYDLLVGGIMEISTDMARAGQRVSRVRLAISSMGLRFAGMIPTIIALGLQENTVYGIPLALTTLIAMVQQYLDGKRALRSVIRESGTLGEASAGAQTVFMVFCLDSIIILLVTTVLGTLPA
jgi:hypothetical protein